MSRRGGGDGCSRGGMKGSRGEGANDLPYVLNASWRKEGDDLHSSTLQEGRGKIIRLTKMGGGNSSWFNSQGAHKV